MNKKNNKFYIYGKHVLKEALSYNKVKCIKKIFLSQNASLDKELVTKIKNVGLNFTITKEDFSLPKDSNHQGVMAEINEDLLYFNYDDFLENIKQNANNLDRILILDRINDSFNFGAILRSAKAFGFETIIIQKTEQSSINSQVIKSSAGMAFKLNIVISPDLVKTVKTLKDYNFIVFGLSIKGKEFSQELLGNKKVVFIIGNESLGISHNLQNISDNNIRINMTEDCESLNVSVATSIIMHEFFKKNINK